MQPYKKHFAVFVALVMVFSLLTPFSSVSKAASFTETFDNWTQTGSSYLDGSFEGNNGVNWDYTGGRASTSIDGKGMMFRDAGSVLISSEIDGGISSLSLDIKADFTTTNPRQLEVYINDVLVGTTPNVAAGSEKINYSLEDLDVEGPFVIQFKKVGSNSQLTVDNIAWTSYEDPTKVSAVQSSVPAGQVAEGTEVAFSTSTADAEIFVAQNGGEYEAYTAPFTLTEDTTFDVYAAADGLDDSDVRTYEYSIIAEESIADVRNQEVGSIVSTTGTVSAVFNQGGANNIYMQNAGAGIVVRSTADVTPGDIISVYGELQDYNGLAQIAAEAEDVVVTGQEEAPAPQPVPETGLSEALEGTLVSVSNVNIASSGSGNYYGTDEFGNDIVIRPATSLDIQTGRTYEVVNGVVGEFNGTYQIVPRSADDVIFDTNQVRPVKADPAGGFVAEGGTVTLSTETEGASIYYTTDGSEPTEDSTLYDGGVTITENTDLKAVAVKEGMTTSDVAEFTYVIQSDDIEIHDIQAAAHFSPYEGLSVPDVEGIVTYVVNSSSFYMQSLTPDEDSRTSEGILVYQRSHGLAEGDHVEVSGTVLEYYVEGYGDRFDNDLPVTQIESTNINEIASGLELPEPVVIGGENGIEVPTEVIDNDNFAQFDPAEDGIDFYESIEGMRVEVAGGTASGPQKYGEIAVLPNKGDEVYTQAGGSIVKPDDFNPERVFIDVDDENFVVKTGDELSTSAIGVMSYGFGKYKVLAGKGQMPAFTDGGLEPDSTTIEYKEDELTIASYNIENFSANTSNTSDEKAQRIADSFINDLGSPDIIALTEVQDTNGPTDDGTVSGEGSYQRLINDIIALGGPEYAYTEVIPEDKQDGGQPGGNIRNGFLYNPERVQLTEGEQGGANDAIDVVDGELTLNPGRIAPSEFPNTRKPVVAEFDFNGEKVIVVGTHLNSKGGDQPLFGQNQPPFLGSEAERVELAAIINSFVQDVQAQTPDANIVVAGDMNDFEFAAPIEALKGEELTNLIDGVEKEERYTYNYEGNAQVLDHILVSNNLADRTAFDIVHINSDFMEVHGRASDHDPLLAQISFKEDIEEPQPEKKVVNLADYEQKKVNIFENDVHIVAEKGLKADEIMVRGTNVSFEGEGLEDLEITLHAKEAGAAYDFEGNEVKSVVVQHKNVEAIYGAENIQKLELRGSAKKAGVTLYDTEGNEIELENEKPGKGKSKKAS
ncbi:chitobiase/beta-hexosaminidase C-terminal domain-containing protein [Jeotgalibacillus haloalkalitolerans]|uniref:Chitobiase/beta-hexosaminidase C-terminal domain-containing protein n=1 Tax=Jeotgalibacillus haloalkalitolerans TaxID=3104292 RepID=A0ABU5KJD5_9BACL|nr:chitobiase/beta-hexosaminidase C-terminal domain-containing protein [Jeotgalibacillus sp. HH7-29]MDZ5710866.1 chitobiase/beta-hexosaminidase C-terminal domain-containing protein [Jeotgalibacillus sp. HH7-29]